MCGAFCPIYPTWSRLRLDGVGLGGPEATLLGAPVELRDDLARAIRGHALEDEGGQGEVVERTLPPLVGLDVLTGGDDLAIAVGDRELRGHVERLTHLELAEGLRRHEDDARALEGLDGLLLREAAVRDREGALEEAGRRLRAHRASVLRLGVQEETHRLDGLGAELDPDDLREVLDRADLAHQVLAGDHLGLADLDLHGLGLRRRSRLGRGSATAGTLGGGGVAAAGRGLRRLGLHHAPPWAYEGNGHLSPGWERWDFEKNVQRSILAKNTFLSRTQECVSLCIFYSSIDSLSLNSLNSCMREVSCSSVSTERGLPSWSISPILTSGTT